MHWFVMFVCFKKKYTPGTCVYDHLNYAFPICVTKFVAVAVELDYTRNISQALNQMVTPIILL